MLPKLIKPMLAAKADAPFDSEQCLFEIKWDGIRCLAFVADGTVKLQSRHLNEITIQFPELGCLDRLSSGTILDGELVVFQTGKPSLQGIQQRALLQNRRRIGLLSKVMPVNYMIFDLLYLKGEPLLAEPLSARRQALESLIQQTSLPGVLMSQGVPNSGCRLFAQVALLGLEGIMAKRLDGPYLPGRRTGYWLKIKPRLSAQVLLTTSAMASAT